MEREISCSLCNPGFKYLDGPFRWSDVNFIPEIALLLVSHLESCRVTFQAAACCNFLPMSLMNSSRKRDIPMGGYETGYLNIVWHRARLFQCVDIGERKISRLKRSRTSWSTGVWLFFSILCWCDNQVAETDITATPCRVTKASNRLGNELIKAKSVSELLLLWLGSCAETAQSISPSNTRYSRLSVLGVDGKRSWRTSKPHSRICAALSNRNTLWNVKTSSIYGVGRVYVTIFRSKSSCLWEGAKVKNGENS